MQDDKMLVGNLILEHVKCQNFKCNFPSSVMHIWKEGTLKCSGLKVYSVVSGKERLFFQPMKALKKKLTSCQTNCYTGTQLFLKSHQHNKTYLTQASFMLIVNKYHVMKICTNFKQKLLKKSVLSIMFLRKVFGP